MTDSAIPDARQRRIRRRIRRSAGFTVINDNSARRVSHHKQHFLATLDKPLVAIVILLLTIGSLMVFSSTFDWSNETYGTGSGFFVEEHLRNVVISVAALAFFAAMDYRFWKRFAFWLLIITLVLLTAVLLYGEERFGATRSFTAGRLQPGELAEFAMVLYMAAWLGSNRTRVASLVYGLLPFLVVVGAVAYLIVQQPDLSSAGIAAMTAGVMFFVAGANLLHIVAAGAVGGLISAIVVSNWTYAQNRIASFLAGLSGDITQMEYHTQQAITAFLRGGWFGVGIGQSQQKFGALPAPHTDSIFAIIGEELGVLGAAVVVALFIAFAIRGFQMARRAKDDFGALLCVGFTSWVIIQALLNIAVMTGASPSTGVPLPFISFGGSSLLVVMIGVGLMLSVNRVATRRNPITERRSDIANFDRSWRNRRARVSRAGNRPSAVAREG